MKTQIKKAIVTTLLGLSLVFVGMGSARAIDCPTLKNVATHIAQKHLDVRNTFENNIIRGAREAVALNMKDGEGLAYIGLSGHLYKLAYAHPGQHPVDVFYNSCQKDGAEPTTLGLVLAGRMWAEEVAQK